jgi:hypothetical protein
VPSSSAREIFSRCVRARRNSSTRTHTRSSLKAVFFSFFSLALRLSLTPPSGGLDEHAAARSLRRWINLIFACWLTHALIRQGLPHSTSERPALPEPGSRVGRGFPLTAQMPQPVRPTSRVHARARTLKITTLPNDLSLRHRHLPRGSRPHEADKLPRHRPLSLPPGNQAVTAMNSRRPSRLHHRLALIVLGRGDGEGGRESPPVEPEPSPCRDFEPTDSAEKPFLFCSSAQSYSSLPGGLDEQATARSL